MTKIIAEFASSWNADPDLLKEMVKLASESGADICKVQDYKAKNVSESDPDKARYEKYQMKDELYPQFISWCKEYGVEPLTSVFNKDRLEYIASLGFKKCKIASVCLTNQELLMWAGLHFEEIILSTGMGTLEEIEKAADILATNAKKFTLLACTAEYPCETEHAGLKRMDTLKNLLDDQHYASVGYSSHALDLDVPKTAITKQAEYLEVHVTVSRETEQIRHQMYEGGPKITTHEIALEPQELKEVSEWRDKLTIMEGSGEFLPTETELKIRERYSGRYGS